MSDNRKKRSASDSIARLDSYNSRSPSSKRVSSERKEMKNKEEQRELKKECENTCPPGTHLTKTCRCYKNEPKPRKKKSPLRSARKNYLVEVRTSRSKSPLRIKKPASRDRTPSKTPSGARPRTLSPLQEKGCGNIVCPEGKHLTKSCRCYANERKPRQEVKQEIKLDQRIAEEIKKSASKSGSKRSGSSRKASTKSASSRGETFAPFLLRRNLQAKPRHKKFFHFYEDYLKPEENDNEIGEDVGDEEFSDEESDTGSLADFIDEEEDAAAAEELKKYNLKKIFGKRHADPSFFTTE